MGYHAELIAVGKMYEHTLGDRPEKNWTHRVLPFKVTLKVITADKDRSVPMTFH